MCYPDPAGGTMNTTGITDHKILKEAGFKLVLPRNMHKGSTQLYVKDRVNNVNANLLSGKDIVRLLINEDDTQPLLKTLTGHTNDPKTGLPTKGKAGGLEHFGDALGYLVWSTSNLYKERVSLFDSVKV